MTHIVPGAAFVMVAIPLAGALAQTLSPAPVFEGNATITAKNGTVQPVHVSVHSWGISGNRGKNDAAHEIPLRGFYIAHLLSGAISSTIDGQTTGHMPGDYWAVNPGASMQVKVLGEYAVLETIVVTKQ